MGPGVARNIKSQLDVLDTIIQEIKAVFYIFVQLLVEKDKMKKISPFKYYVKFNIVFLSKKISQISRYKKSLKFLYLTIIQTNQISYLLLF